MKKKMLRKDIRKCFSKSKGRFFSILCLIALGSFALVGLQVAGPDMRQTGENYFENLKLADISIIGDYGIDDDNVAAINQVSGANKIEYGYLKDVVIKDTETSIRVFSQTNGISEYELVDGSMPKSDDEVALASFLSDDYSIGDTIEFTEKEDTAGNTVLKHPKMKIVGFVNSSELLSIINMGQSTAGTGELQGYAVVTADAFDSDVYMIARLSFADTQGVDPYSAEYTELISAHKDELNALLADQPSQRLASIKSEYQQKIDDAQKEIDDAQQKLDDALQELTDGETELANAKQEYEDGLDEYDSESSKADKKLKSAKSQIDDAKEQIENAEAEITPKRELLNQSKAELDSARSTLDAGWADYNEKAAQLETLKQTKSILEEARSELNSKIDSVEGQTGMSLDYIEMHLSELQETLPTEQYEMLCQLVSAKNELSSKWSEYNQAAAQAEGAEEALESAKTELENGETDYAAKKAEYDEADQQLAAAETELASKKSELEDAESEYKSQKSKVNKKLKESKSKLDDAKEEIENAESELADGWAEYNEKKPDADQEIADAKEKVTDAQDTLDRLEQPVYALDTRREIPGSEGYRVYSTIANIIDALADVFPIFLYFVAALVTLTTMTRFVDEERINSGTLKALGYCNRDIVKKFTVYGLTAGLIGTAIGVAAGHILMPMIVYNAYGKSFTYPQIVLHFYPIITAVAVVCAILCSVVPAYIVAMKELREKPAALLQPKAPQAGSKIMLERIPLIWNHLSFTHKVTARNLFRYKKRMLMTIFGVCGAVALIFTGFSVQNSISNIKGKQFGEILHYDIIVAENSGLSSEQKDEIDGLLTSDAVKSSMPIHYETVSKSAGANNDSQSIKLIVPGDTNALSEYITLRNRRTGESLTFQDDGCVITERLAKLLSLSVGDTIEFSDDNNVAYTAKVTGITEMYTGHFMFMNRACYESVFSKTYTGNAYLVALNDSSSDNTKLQASLFMALDGVKSVVQNTTMTNQIDTIVKSLNRIMQILIIVAMMLAVVILYNLTNINVSERIRELSTIKVLGFYNKEVTMYIYRETILLTIIGILAGFGLGDLLYRYILAVVPPDEVMFNPALGSTAFIVPTIVIAIITLVLGLMMNRRLKNVGMLEALKSVD